MENSYLRLILPPETNRRDAVIVSRFMPRMAQFVLALLVGLALLTWAASAVVQTTAREWFERDVNSRAQIILVGASKALASVWDGESSDLNKELNTLARDEHVM